MALDSAALRFAAYRLLPVGVGILLGLLMRPGSRALPAPAPPPGKQEEAMLPLGDEPAKVKLAALAGRTREARAKVADLIASGAKDEEIAEWLAPILIADPGALDDLVAGIPEERRFALVRAALVQVISLHPDSVWEVIRASPLAAQSARAKVGNRPGLDLLIAAGRSPLAAEVLFDPANGFTTEEITRYLRFGGRGEANARRILDEWIAGRWQGDPPECIRSAWATLRRRDEPALQALVGSMSEPLKKKVGEFEAWSQVGKSEDMFGTLPTKEELNLLGGQEVDSLAERRGMAGKPLPLDLLASLPEDKRGDALKGYFQWSYPFSVAAAREAIDQIDKVPLTGAEKDGLLRQAAREEWRSQGEIDRALDLVARINGDKDRESLQMEILEELAHFDPRAALAHVQQMPAGDLRDKIEKLATDSLP